MLQISGAGHWFLEGWIGDNSVEFLVDSVSSMTAMSDSLYQKLVRAGAPVGALGYTSRTLRSANGTGIGVSGCSHWVVSFMGLQTEFLILVCDLATGTDAIIGTDVLGSVLPHTLDINNGLLFTDGGRLTTVTSEGHRSFQPCFHGWPLLGTTLFGGRTPLHRTYYRWSSYALQWVIGGPHIICGKYRPCRGQWRVPVLVSDFSQDTVMVEPFSEVGMVAHISAIQAVTEPMGQPACGGESLPIHLRDLLGHTSRNLDDMRQRQLAGVLLRYSDLFPVPGSTLTGHTDAVEHEINTGDGSPIRCAPRRMSPQKMTKEEECVAEMLTGDQIEPSDSPWSSPVVLVTKKDGGTRFCVDYRWLNDATVKDAYPLPRIDDTLDMLAGIQWFSTLDLASGYWQVSLSQEARTKTAFATHSGLFQFKVMPFGLCNAPATFERLMDRVLQGLRWSRCLVYLDDIIIFGSTFGGALDNLTLIFERLRSYGLQLKSTKCHLHFWDILLAGVAWNATR